MTGRILRYAQVGELLPIVREYGSDANGASPLPMSRRKRRTLAAVLLLWMRMKTRRVARSIATNRYRREV